jgi:hypothetical protein
MIIEVLIDIAPEFGFDDPGAGRAMAINAHVLVCDGSSDSQRSHNCRPRDLDNVRLLRRKNCMRECLASKSSEPLHI